MHKLTRRGFTFVELLVALVLMGIISTSIYSLMRTNQKVYSEQSARIELNQNVRAAVGILPAELRELDASDPNGGDIVDMTSSSVTYNGMRNTYILCQYPDSANLKLIVSPTTWYGLQPIDVTDQKFLLYQENDFNTRTDDQWLHVGASAAAAGTACPIVVAGVVTVSTGAASLTLTLTGTTKAALSNVTNGSPIRGYKPTRIGSYADANGEYWLGLQTQNVATNAWGAIEPMAGPIADSTGLALTYYKSDGTTTTDRSLVARIGITVSGRTQDKVRARGGAQEYITSDLSAQAALRNNRRW